MENARGVSAPSIDVDYHALFESVPGLYLILDPDLIIVAATDAYLAATMTKRNEIVGRGVFDVFPDDPENLEANADSNLRDSLDRVRTHLVADTMATHKYDLPRPEVEGGGLEVRYWSPVNAPVLDGEGRLRWIINRVEDITESVQARAAEEEQVRAASALKAELIQRSEELSVANEELKRASQVKSDFLATMSHELRTPLNAILGFTDLIRAGATGPISDRANDYLERVGRNGRQLLGLINDVLDLSKVEAGRTIVAPKVVAIEPIARGVMETIEPMASARGLTLEVTDRSRDGTAAFVDPQIVRQILTNLVGNAVKFCDSGNIAIAISAKDSAVMIAVTDTGRGIAPADQALVFEPFGQAGPDTGHGTGLGLAISARLALIMGGGLTVTSELGVGSTFTLSVPAVRRSVALAGAAPDGPLVLGVDDDDDSLALWQAQVEAHHCAFLGVGRTTSALAAALKLSPAIILLDLVFPDDTGWALLERPRADERTAAIPVIVISVSDGEERAAETGVSFLQKPVSSSDFDAAFDPVLATVLSSSEAANASATSL